MLNSRKYEKLQLRDRKQGRIHNCKYVNLSAAYAKLLLVKMQNCTQKLNCKNANLHFRSSMQKCKFALSQNCNAQCKIAQTTFAFTTSRKVVNAVIKDANLHPLQIHLVG